MTCEKIHVSNFTAFGLFAPQQDKVRNPAACAVFSAPADQGGREGPKICGSIETCSFMFPTSPLSVFLLRNKTRFGIQLSAPSLALQLIHHQARPAEVKPGGLAEERWAEAIKTGRKALAVEMASRECFGRAGNIEPAATSWR